MNIGVHVWFCIMVFKYCVLTCIWNLEKQCRWTYLQGRNRDADVENRLGIDGRAGDREGGMNGESSIEHIYAIVYRIDSQWEAAI